MAGPLMGMLGQMGGAMFGTQVGSAIGGLAAEVLTASDIGLPLGPAGKAALVPTNVTAFAEGLDVSEDDVLLYLALREAAHQRLFAHVPWLREHLIGRGRRLRPRHHHRHRTAWRSRSAGIDPTDPSRDPAGARGRAVRARQDARPRRPRCTRLETTLALVEGWVDEVVGQATARADAGRRQDAGGRTPPPRRRRSGRGDLRGPGRPGAASAPAARRLDAVGLAALPPGHRGPRRGLDAPRPAAHLDRPRRPAGLPRGPRRGDRDGRRRLRRRAGAAARRGHGRRRRHRPGTDDPKA